MQVLLKKPAEGPRSKWCFPTFFLKYSKAGPDSPEERSQITFICIDTPVDVKQIYFTALTTTSTKTRHFDRGVIDRILADPYHLYILATVGCYNSISTLVCDLRSRVHNLEENRVDDTRRPDFPNLHAVSCDIITTAEELEVFIRSLTRIEKDHAKSFPSTLNPLANTQSVFLYHIVNLEGLLTRMKLLEKRIDNQINFVGFQPPEFRVLAKPLTTS
jgi:hypothetical protein